MAGIYHGFHKLPRSRYPRAKPLIEIGGSDSGGAAALAQSLTINGTTVAPTFWYQGENASASGWTATVGDDLTAAGSGGTFGDDVPMPTAAGKAFNGDGSRYFSASDTALGSMTTEDFVVEGIICQNTGSNGRFASTFTTGYGWAFYNNANDKLAMYIYSAGGGQNIQTAAASVSPGIWYHFMAFASRSTTGFGQAFLNGTASGAAVDLSSVTDISNSQPLTLGADADGTNAADRPIAFVALWKRANWLDTHLQATIAQQRFATLTGVASTRYGYPTHTDLRSTVAHMEKQASTDGQRIFAVGPRWPRIETVPDAVLRYSSGYRSELAATNKLVNTHAPDGASWTQTRCTVGDDDVNGPTRFQDAHSVSEDGTATATHVVTQAVNVTADTYLVSVCAKASNRAWFRLSLSSPTDGDESVYFDLVGGVIGTTTGTVRQGIRYLGQGWHHCWFTRTHATAEAGTFSIDLADADGSNSFSGASQESILIWGPMVVQDKGSPVTYVESGAAATERTADVLEYTSLALPVASTMVCDILSDTSGAAAVRAYVSRNADAATNRSLLWTNGSEESLVTSITGGATVANITATTSLVNRLWRELRATIATDNVKLYVDGTLEGTPDTSAVIATNHDQLDIGCAWTQGSQPDAVVRFRLYNNVQPTRDVTDYGDIMALSTGYISSPSAVAQSTSYANIGGTWTEVSATDFTFATATGIWTYDGTDTKTFLIWAAISGAISAGTPLLTTTIEKNGSAVTASEMTRKISTTNVGAWAICVEVSLATNDTINLATKVDTGTPDFTPSKCTVIIHEV
ncbi:MAG: hypothetical protein GWN29_04870 [Gammaproteobacteria bacterium]|nr:LamG domain-containing protein [Gammaproteobacteria bacterium]NIV51087.1 hypothetical protein [Gammaproteobacteria bacterium]NIW23938.1 hypothetical protein [Gammaproteobacteria bacterium]NIX85030.1 hypothetical protein [Gammaproteobacteria bacterium]